MSTEKGTTFRARLSARAKRSIEKIAEQYNCTYGGKGSISDLLNKIADGHLTVKRPTISERKISGNSLIKLQIKAQKGIRGTIYIISKSIADCQGNILDIKETPIEGDFGIFHLLISLEKNVNLAKLLNSLLEIKIENIQEFNDDWILENKRIKRKFEYSSFEYSSFEKFKQQNLLIDIRCILGIEINIPNKQGSLSEITKIIADEKALIDSLSQDFDSQKDNAIVRLFLLLKLETRTETKTEVEKITKIMSEIRKKFKVERLNAEYLI
ncbi:MAG: hypothetical protein AAGA80_02710 [Cyanobacteria bacterium P01_F01_bin.143]